MTNDHDLQIRVLKRVLDWHEAPANAPRRLDMTWQDAVAFFGLPASSDAEVGTSWDTLYEALSEMAEDDKLQGEIYVNRVRDLRPGYRGAIELQAADAAKLAEERAELDEQAVRLASERRMLDAARSNIDALQESAAATRQELEQKAVILKTREAAQATAQAELDERQSNFERERAVARREAEGMQAAASEELRVARGWRFAGVLAMVVAIGVAVAMAAGQGWILTGSP